MTRLLRYTPDQWDQLRAMPWLVVAAVMDSDRSGPIGTGHEMSAARRAIAGATRSGARGRLAYRVAEELIEENAGKPLPSLGEPKWQVALDRLRRGVATLDDAAPARDSEDFRAWLWEIAQEVANAAREGFAGLGARVSTEEQAVLDEIRLELRMP